MYPKRGEKFKLTLTTNQCDGIVMLERFGYDTEDWEYKGDIPETLTIEKRKFELVQIDFCSNLDEVKEKLKKLGKKIPSGLFLQPLLDQYPTPAGKVQVGIADDSWVGPGGRRFPFVNSVGHPRFDWAHSITAGYWWWLVFK